MDIMKIESSKQELIMKSESLVEEIQSIKLEIEDIGKKLDNRKYKYPINKIYNLKSSEITYKAFYSMESKIGTKYSSMKKIDLEIALELLENLKKEMEGLREEANYNYKEDRKNWEIALEYMKKLRPKIAEIDNSWSFDYYDVSTNEYTMNKGLALTLHFKLELGKEGFDIDIIRGDLISHGEWFDLEGEQLQEYGELLREFWQKYYEHFTKEGRELEIKANEEEFTCYKCGKVESPVVGINIEFNDDEPISELTDLDYRQDSIGEYIKQYINDNELVNIKDSSYGLYCPHCLAVLE